MIAAELKDKRGADVDIEDIFLSDGADGATRKLVEASIDAGAISLAVPELPQAQDQAGPATGEVPVGVFAGLAQRAKNAASAPRLAAVFSAAVQPGACSTERNFSSKRVRRMLTTRIQRSRERGSRQPVNTKYCGRPTEWGNPFPIGEEYTRTEALEAFREAFWAHELLVTPTRVRAELAAYDYLSCWCRLDQPCHVDEYIRAISCEHNLRDVDGRSCPVCRACLHRDIAIEGPQATCQDCGKTFVGW